MNATVTFSFNDFNTSTRRSLDTRKHGMAEIRRADGGVYIFGALGCGKTAVTVVDALKAYLGGRELIVCSVFDDNHCPQRFFL